MTNFTQGRWTACADGSIDITDPAGKILHCYIDIVADTDNPEGLANSRLIAHAPEMYGELYEALQLLQGKSSYDGDEFSQQAESIRELLARIDGKEE